MQGGPWVERLKDCKTTKWCKSRRYMPAVHYNVPNPATLRSMPIETQRLSPHGGFQCHDLLGLSSMQAYAVCRTAGGIASAYATGHEGVTFCVENSSGCAPNPTASGNTNKLVLLYFLLTSCELQAAGACICKM